MPDELSPARPFDDVRMRGFARRTTVAAALAWLDARLTPLTPDEVPLPAAAGRVLASDIVSSVDMPLFDRSMMDGFAVCAEDTLGATSYNRLPLKLVGTIRAGPAETPPLKHGETVKIMTGAPLPTGANAVLPAEFVDAGGDGVWAFGEVSPGKNVGRRGEDITRGSIVLRTGRALRPQDLGLLASIGVGAVSVVRQPRVRIVATGNELLPQGSFPAGYKIVDANSPMLTALIVRDGGIPIQPGIVPDDPPKILAALRSDADIVVVSGGSSVGEEDYSPSLLAEYGDLAIHGIAMRPSSPTGMGTLDGRLVLLLPGNPVSCLCAYDFFAGRAIRVLGGRGAGWPYRTCQLPLRRKLVSTVGRLDYARVHIVDEQIEPIAIGGASVLSSTTCADGFVIIPEDCEGYPAGTSVTVFLY